MKEDVELQNDLLYDIADFKIREADMKKAIKITVIAVAACVVIFLAIGFISLAVHPEELAPSAAVQTDDGFLALARQAVEAEGYADEPIAGVALDGRDLRIAVDMSKSTLNGYRDDAAVLGEMLRGKSDHYTEAVLALGSQYDELWDTITVDFGELGMIVNHVEDIQTSENGERFFPSWNYEIQN